MTDAVNSSAGVHSEHALPPDPPVPTGTIPEQIAACRAVLLAEDAAKARILARELDEAVPASVEELQLLTDFYTELGSHGWGLVFAQRFLVGREADIDAVLMVARAYHTAGFPKEASEMARRALAFPNIEIPFLQDIVAIFLVTHSTADAVPVIHRLIELRPDDVALKCQSVHVTARAFGPDAARADLERIREYAKSHRPFRAYVGCLALELGFMNDAEADFQAALPVVTPADMGATFELTRLAMSLGHFDEARRRLADCDVDGEGNFFTWMRLFDLGNKYMLTDVSRIAARRCLQINHGYLPALDFIKGDRFRRHLEQIAQQNPTPKRGLFRWFSRTPRNAAGTRS